MKKMPSSRNPKNRTTPSQNKIWLRFSLMTMFFAFLSLGASLWISRWLLLAESNNSDDFSVKRFVGKDNPAKVRLEYIAIDSIETLGKIEGSYKKNTYLTTNDTIYLRLKNSAVSVGDRFTIFTNRGKINNRSSKLQIRGFVQITQVTPTTVVGKIYNAGLDIKIGDLIGPEMNIQLSLKPQEPTARIFGKVADATSDNSLLGAYDFVFIDRGEAEGLRVNDTLDVVRTADGKSEIKEGLPLIVVAKLVAVQVAQHSALAYVWSSSDTFSKGATFKSSISEVRYLDDKPIQSAPAK